MKSNIVFDTPKRVNIKAASVPHLIYKLRKLKVDTMHIVNIMDTDTFEKFEGSIETILKDMLGRKEELKNHHFTILYFYKVGE